MKVLIVTRDFPPYLVGGMGVFIDNVSRLLAQSGIEVAIIGPHKEGAAGHEQLQRNLEVYRTAMDIIPIIGKYFVTKIPVQMLSSYRLIKRLDYDILHLFTPILSRAINKDANVIYHFQSTRYGEFKACKKERKLFHALANWLYIAPERILAKRADKIIVVSERMREELGAFVPHRDLDISVLPNGADLDLFHPNKRTPGIEPFILFVGRLDARKGIEGLLKAYKLVHAKSNASLPKLHIVGSGPLHRSLKKRYEDQNIRFLGRKDHRKELPQIYANAALTVVPSTYEPCSLVIKESLASSTPVITSDCNPDVGMPQFRTGDYQELVKLLLSILGNPDKLETLRKKSRGIAEAYSWKNITGELIKIYEDLLKKK